MARLPSAAPHTLWILFFSYTTNEVMAAGHVQEFACFSDYDKELVCHWKVPAQINCSREFLLSYRTYFSPKNVCVPENGKDSLSCTCTICPDYFVSALTYLVTLTFNGTDTWNYSVTPALVVKPRAPKNLTVKKAENGNFNLSWEEAYSPPSMLSGQPVIYEVKYWSKQHATEVSVKAINYQAKNFEIAASSLRRGYDYVASVRCNYTDYPAYWSEWSEEVEFHYDYQVTAEDILQMAVPVSCILIMAVSVMCYFCFTKVKKEWWDQIPNPAKSHLVVKNVKFSVLCYIDEIKFPFHDLKQSHMENQISCKNCLAQSLSNQNFKGKGNIGNAEKSCSCHSKSGEWLPKGSSADLTPETILVEESVEICECLTDVEAESQEETSDQLTTFEPCESSVSAFREHTEHNDALARMFIDLLADENSMQGNEDPDIITEENKTFEKFESENPSQRSPKESAAQSQQPCDISHTVSLFTKAFQDNYNCSTDSKKSEQSEESFESGYRSSSINSASLDARDLQHMVHQRSLFPCSSESQHDLCVLIQESPNKPSFGTKKDRISNPALKSCDTLVSPPVEPCGLGYKSCDTLVSPPVEPCDSGYKSFDILVSASKEPSSIVYKSFDSLMSQSVANSSLTQCFKNMCSSPPLTQFSETVELSCRDQIYQPPSNQTCYANYRSPCSEPDFQNTCSEHTDFPSFSTHTNDSASAFLPEEEIYKQVMYQNVQKKANRSSCPIGPQPSGYQPFDNAVKCHGMYSDNDSEVISRSFYEPFICHLYNNLRETPPDTIVCEPDQRTDDRICVLVQGFDCSLVPGSASSDNVTETSDGSLWIIDSNELFSDSKDENTSRDEQLLHLVELNCQDFNSRERTIKGTKPDSFNCTGKGTQESISNRLNTAFHCHTHNYLGKLGNAGENKEVIKHVVGRRCGSASGLPEESLDSTGLNTDRKSAEPLELLVPDKLSPPLFVDNSCPDSHTVSREGSGLAPAVKKSPVELLRENNRKNEKKIKLVQVLAQEDNCYMKVA
ncbi:interleukin-4 receptor subunit alpha [Athene cunicularia]|uniref:interleukin-4 receptor subunit alpha n=1 Tax=Athene cunicularia TaxID=194338 RepID=UPI000EF6D4B3|nr:interleukin-4 receptor subunit alpha [Athene cunicularia]